MIYWGMRENKLIELIFYHTNINDKLFKNETSGYYYGMTVIRTLEFQLMEILLSMLMIRYVALNF